MKSIISFLILFLLLNSCEEEFKHAVFETTTIEKPFAADISITFDKAVEDNTLSKHINNNIEKAIIASLNSTENETDLTSILNDFNSEYIEFKKAYAEDFESAWELHIETELTYQSNTVITIAINTYEFKGGAHGNDKIKFLNIDAKTGDVLTRNQIITNSTAFKTLAKDYFIKSLDIEATETIVMEDFFFGKPYQLPENIGFSDDGLVLLYNTYEIASYEPGYTEFVIPLAEAKPYIIAF